MTKEEFMTMLETELESINVRLHEAYEKADYYNRTKQQGVKEDLSQRYEVSLLREKMFFLTQNLSFPAFARIASMSEIEIESYKQSKIEEIEVKIIELEETKKDLETRLEALKRDHEQLAAQYANSKEEVRDILVAKGQRITFEIGKLEGIGGQIYHITRDISELKMQQENIKSKNSDEIKQELADKIQESVRYAQLMQSVVEEDFAPGIVYGNVGEDGKKAQRVAEEMTLAKNAFRSSEKLSDTIIIPDLAPELLVSRLKTGFNDKGVIKINDTKETAEIIADFMEKYNEHKKKYEEEFTPAKLSQLVGKENYRGIEVNFELISSHSDKLDPGKVNLLRTLLDERDQLSKKIFKTSAIKDQISILNINIRNLQTQLLNNIIYWYRSFDHNVLGLRTSIDFTSTKTVESGLEMQNREMKEALEAIEVLEKRLQESGVYLDSEKARLGNERSRREATIREEVGLSEETIIPIPDDTVERNLDTIARDSRYEFAKEVIRRVVEESKRQADIKEAELRGISLEELTNLRKEQSQVKAKTK